MGRVDCSHRVCGDAVCAGIAGVVEWQIPSLLTGEYKAEIATHKVREAGSDMPPLYPILSRTAPPWANCRSHFGCQMPNEIFGGTIIPASRNYWAPITTFVITQSSLGLQTACPNDAGRMGRRACDTSTNYFRTAGTKSMP